MIQYRILSTALLFTLCVATASAQKGKGPSFPIIPPLDSSAAAHIDASRARLHAASLARKWLDERDHPAKDSVDFPPGLVASLANALMRLEATTAIPQLDSALRWLRITPDEWNNTTGILIIDLKRSRWGKAFYDGKKKTGNGAIDALVKRYGLRVARTVQRSGDSVMIRCTTDSLVNMWSLTRKLFAIKGWGGANEMAFAAYKPSSVRVTERDDRWRFIYEYSGDKGKFRWAFDVLTDGSVVHTRLRQW